MISNFSDIEWDKVQYKQHYDYYDRDGNICRFIPILYDNDFFIIRTGKMLIPTSPVCFGGKDFCIYLSPLDEEGINSPTVKLIKNIENKIVNHFREEYPDWRNNFPSGKLKLIRSFESRDGYKISMNTKFLSKGDKCMARVYNNKWEEFDCLDIKSKSTAECLIQLHAVHLTKNIIKLILRIHEIYVEEPKIITHHTMKPKNNYSHPPRSQYIPPIRPVLNNNESYKKPETKPKKQENARPMLMLNAQMIKEQMKKLKPTNSGEDEK